MQLLWYSVARKITHDISSYEYEANIIEKKIFQICIRFRHFEKKKSVMELENNTSIHWTKPFHLAYFFDNQMVFIT